MAECDHFTDGDESMLGTLADGTVECATCGARFVAESKLDAALAAKVSNEQHIGDLRSRMLHDEKAHVERLKDCQGENRQLRELLNTYNLGGWTDGERLIKERDSLASRLQASELEVERVKQAWRDDREETKGERNEAQRRLDAIRKHLSECPAADGATIADILDGVVERQEIK